METDENMEILDAVLEKSKDGSTLLLSSGLLFSVTVAGLGLFAAFATNAGKNVSQNLQSPITVAAVILSATILFSTLLISRSNDRKESERELGLTKMKADLRAERNMVGIETSERLVAKLSKLSDSSHPNAAE